MTAAQMVGRLTAVPGRTFQGIARRGGQASTRTRRVVVGAAGFVALALVAAVVLLVVSRVHASEVASARVDGQRASQDLVTQVLSYDAQTIDQDSTRTKDLLAGPFKDEFGTILDQVIVPKARQAAIKTSATVTAASVVDASPDSATVLLFVNQQTTSNQSPTPAVSGSRVRATVTSTEAGWKLTALDPV